MKVKDLLNELSRMDGDLEVVVADLTDAAIAVRSVSSLRPVCYLETSQVFPRYWYDAETNEELTALERTKREMAQWRA